MRTSIEGGTTQGESKERASRRANREWRAFVRECLDPVDKELKWWDRHRWAECCQELERLGSKIPGVSMVAVRAGATPTDWEGFLPTEEEVALMMVQTGVMTAQGIPVRKDRNVDQPTRPRGYRKTPDAT
jgi:hypothetical protein